MRGTYCYLPILRARWGAFQAIGELSPIARSRLTPLFDVPVPTSKNGKTLETYLAERACRRAPVHLRYPRLRASKCYQYSYAPTPLTPIPPSVSSYSLFSKPVLH